MVSMIEKDDMDFCNYRIQIKDFMQLIDTKAKNEYARGKEITKSLISRTLEIPTRTGFLQTAWLSSAEYHVGKGYVDLCFDPKLKPYLLKLKEKFTKYNIQCVLLLRSVYSIRIYEIAKQYEGLGVVTYSVEKLKELLGIRPGEYSKYKVFKQKVLLKAKVEISEKTDIEVDFKEKRKAKGKVTAIEFFFCSKNTDTEESESSEEGERMQPGPEGELEGEGLVASEAAKEFDSLIALLPVAHRHKKTVLKAVYTAYRDRGYEYVSRNIKYTNRNCNGNYRVYLKSALLEDWGLEIQEDEDVRKSNRAAERKLVGQVDTEQADSEREEV
jgi:plasmid replication initiation protein